MKKATLAALAAAAIAGVSTVQAAVYWDADGDTTSATGGSGTWGDASATWRSGSATGTLGAWAYSSPTDVDFGGNAGTITLRAGTTTVNAMTFETSGYVINGGASDFLKFAATPTVTVGTDMEVTFNANTSGTFFHKQGSGTLILNGSSALSSKSYLEAGTLAIGNNTALGTGVIQMTGGTLRIDGQARTLSNTFALEVSNASVTIAGSYGLSAAGFANTQSGTWTVNVPVLTLGAGSLATAAASKTLTLSGSGNVIASGAISNGTNVGNVAYVGTGSLSFNANNSYTGYTTINNSLARVYVNGLTNGQGDYTVTAGTLGGSGGTIGLGTDKKVVVVSGAHIAPGTTAGTTGVLAVSGTQTTAALGASTVNLASGSNFDVDANAAIPGSGYDQLDLTGTISLNSANLVFNLNPSLILTGNESFTIIKNDGSEAVLGTFANLAQGAVVTSQNGYSVKINYSGGDGNDVVLSVPEPGSLGLFCAGSLFVMRRRRRC